MTGPTVGASGVARLTVSEQDTAEALGSGDVPVLGTPRVVALVEEATCAAIAGTLIDGSTSVGTRVEVEHLLPSPIGAQIEAAAVLESIEGRTLHFAAAVTEGDRTIARGRVTRVIVARARFGRA